MKYKSTLYTGENKYWDDFVENSNNGTIFHKLSFLSYHGKKYINKEHHIGIYKGEMLIGVMPLLIDDRTGKRQAISPYGGSYGGPVFKDSLDYNSSVLIVESILGYLKSIDVNSLKICLPMRCCYVKNSDTFTFALHENNFKLLGREICSVIDLREAKSVDEVVSGRARNMARKAVNHDIEIIRRAELKMFSPLLEATYKKHDKLPTHNKQELEELLKKYPNDIWIDVARYNNRDVAGIFHIKIKKNVDSLFYIVSDKDFLYTQASSLLIYNAIDASISNGDKWFDFGTSSENMVGRPNLFRFKESFGAIGMFREIYTRENI